ncbi:hypothetical protein [Gordonia mangrovi]|uniref:hypothetical protein n=1 Tax=Gordonia mangrovi TaxID=2665643 RepID=UPI0019257DF9|nr:hypothetical protein [Gordonia mangrovi]UVF80009.1 hypothetical protein NWF22_09380 [Gordonia mangrovi]
MTAAAIETDRSRDYVTIMRCAEGDDLLDGAIPQLAAWLREKDFDVDLSESGDYGNARASLTVRRIDSDSTTIRIELQEDGGNTGRWSTEVIADGSTDEGGWISLSVRNSQARFVKVPRLARYLMQALPLRDGQLEFASGHQLFGSASVDRLVSILEDDRRHGLVFVAGTNNVADIPVDAFARKVDQWAREVYGLAQVIVLDPHSTEVFRQRVGDQLAAPVWAIRSYQPGVTWDDALDARRHRILGTRSLGSKGDRAIQYLLGEIARQQASTRPPDATVQKMRRRYDRLENRRLVKSLENSQPEDATEPSVHEASPPEEAAATAPPQHDEEITLVRRVLGLKEITERTLTEFVSRIRRSDPERAGVRSLENRVDLLQTRVEQLEDQNQQLLNELKDSQLETELARIDVDEIRDRARWLESRLNESGDYESQYLDVPPEFRVSRPQSFDELLDRIDQIDSVCFTGDTSEVARLNQLDTNDSALRTAWDAVLAMADYARARAESKWDGSLDQYLHNTPSGFQTFPPGKFGETETGRTMKQFGDERVFPVPTDVDPREQVEMKAHFKLARIGMASPRMHISMGTPQFRHCSSGTSDIT